MFNLFQIRVNLEGAKIIMNFSVSGSRTENGIVIKEGKSGEYGAGTWLGYQL